MDTFETRLRDCRKEKDFSQNELAKILETNHSVIGKYERDEVKPSIDVVKKIAKILETTVAYLLGEDQNQGWFPGTPAYSGFYRYGRGSVYGCSGRGLNRNAAKPLIV